MYKFASCFFLLLFLLTVAQAQERRFDDWYAGRTDNGDWIAATVENNASEIFAFRCYRQVQRCVHLLVVDDLHCHEGQDYPVLINSDHGSLATQGFCSDGEGGSELALREFDTVNRMARRARVLGFAIPRASGYFRVVRFSMHGSGRAMDFVERRTEDHGHGHDRWP